MSMNPYPWTQERAFTPRKGFLRWITYSVGVVFLISIAITGPVAVIAALWAAIMWQRKNNNPIAYPAVLAAFGLWFATAYTLINGAATGTIALLILAASTARAIYSSRTGDGPGTRNAAIITVITAAIGVVVVVADKGIGALGPLHAVDEVATSAQGAGRIVTLWLYTWPYGLLAAALFIGVWSMRRDYETQRYLNARTPTRRQLRREIFVRETAAEHQPADYLTPATITGDLLPWRQDRYGEPIFMPTDELGHGLVLGKNGSGKTIFGIDMVDQTCDKGFTTIMLDFKGDHANRDKLAAIADYHGVDFYTYDLAGNGCFYDPLDFDADDSERIALVVQSFEFETTNEAYYQGIADDWLKAQFRILRTVGAREGEGTFDFLYATASVAGAKARLDDIKESDPGIYTRLFADVNAVENSDLQGLRSNLKRIVDTPAGSKMRRPTPEEVANGANYINFRELAPTGAVLWFGLTAGADSKTSKMLGALVCYDLTQFSAWRNTNRGEERHDMFVLADEFSLLGEYIGVVKNLVRTARSSRIWVWVMAQTLAAFPDEIATEFKTNAYWYAVFSLPDKESAIQMEELSGTIPYRSLMSEVSVRESWFKGRKMDAEGMGRTQLDDGPHIPATQFMNLPPQHAYLWSSNNDRSELKKWWRRGRPTYKDDCVRDIPQVRAVAAARVLTAPAHTVETINDVATELADTATPAQINSIHMFAGKMPRRVYDSVLASRDVHTLHDLTRSDASALLTDLVHVVCQALHTAAGTDRYVTEYNKIAVFCRYSQIGSSETEVQNSYRAPGVEGATMLYGQLQRFLPAEHRTDSADEGAASARSGFDGDEQEPPPMYRKRPRDASPATELPDDIEYPAHGSDNLPVSADSTRPVPPPQIPARGPSAARPAVLPTTPDPAHTNAKRQQGTGFDDDDEPHYPLPGIGHHQPHSAPTEALHVSTWDDTETAPPSLTPETATTDSGAHPDAGPDSTAEDTSDAERERAVNRMAWILLRVDPEQFGGHQGITYGPQPPEQRPSKTMWNAAFEEAEQTVNQIS